MIFPLSLWMLAVVPTASPQSMEVSHPEAVREVRVTVGKARIRALCTPGRRRIVMLHDVASDAESWRPVLERLDGRVGACAYDRPGSGLSGPPPSARGWYELVDELRRIHEALGLDPEPVVVGHGTGGLYARVFALDRPGDVGALVLVDPEHEDLPSEARQGMPDEDWEAWMDTRARPNVDGVRTSAVGERARGRRLTEMPVTVLTAARRLDAPGWDARFLDEASRRVHASILRGVSASRHIPAERSGRDVPVEQPDLVAAEILRAARSLARVARSEPAGEVGVSLHLDPSRAGVRRDPLHW